MISISTAIVFKQFELCQKSSEKTNKPSYRPVSPYIDWFMVGVFGDNDFLIIKSSGIKREWEDIVNVLSIKQEKLEELISGWNGMTCQIKFPSLERNKLMPFVIDLIKRVNIENTYSSMIEIINQWVNLWKRVKGPMNLKSQRGLIGELLILKKLIIKHNSTVITYWTGPERTPQDFTSLDWRIEVKTIGTSLARPTISSLEQLLPSDDYSLYLILVSIDEGNTFSLNSLIIEIKRFFSSEQLEVFIHKINLAGYYLKHKEYYEKRYDLVDTLKYKITPTSNILNIETLPKDITSVENLKWILKIEELPFKKTDATFWNLFKF